MQSYDVNLIWDAEAAVWIAASEDIPGLVMESGSLDALIERVRNVAPELLEVNRGIKARTLSIRFISERYERVTV